MTKEYFQNPVQIKIAHFQKLFSNIQYCSWLHKPQVRETKLSANPGFVNPKTEKNAYVLPCQPIVNQLSTTKSLNTNSKNLTTNNGQKFISLHSCLLYLGMVDEFTMSVRRLKIKVRSIIAVFLVFILLIVDWARLVLRYWNFLKTNMTKLLNLYKVKT